MTKNEISRTRRKWRQKRYTAELRGLQVLLTFDQYCELMQRAGITVDDIGQKADQYCLARYNDEGDYSIDNCRFITIAENNQEAARTKRDHALSMGGGSYESVKGNNHHKSRGYVVTPWGTFETLREAADHPGATCNYQKISQKIRQGKEGYFYSEG